MRNVPYILKSSVEIRLSAVYWPCWILQTLYLFDEELLLAKHASSSKYSIWKKPQLSEDDLIVDVQRLFGYSWPLKHSINILLSSVKFEYVKNY